MNIYEMFGHQAEQIERLRDYFRVTQQVLQDLRDGKVSPSTLVVTDQGWTVNAADEAGDETSEENR